ncbi:hypothetical protein QBC35DRAFT_389363 [Podospora australis]|uniref:Zinc finger C2H2 LYAR-type domain-containing protein n=1 Tax=Podospora australis TaxID=1536484 RepID=A0AAN6WP72_9PEZI|nr:hypothetical protein QBC35DRAFT_389363 [Podospora australis]
MVSFSCENCGDIFTKKKLDPHRNRCRGATFTCIDCMVHFPGTEYRWHTSCMSEAQKYQGALYKGKKETQAPAPPAHNAMAHPAYVEEVAEDFDSWRDYEQRSDDDSRSVNLPEAPTPPSAVEAAGDNVNVFDFLIDNPTPSASTLALPATANVPSEENQLVRFDPEANDIENFDMNDGSLVHYETGAVPVNNFETPAPKAQRKKIRDTDTVKKSDKKRKRLHIETDQIMTDAPPVMHSGLTGGLNRMMRPSVFPPSPGDSGDNIATPASPLKKSKSKHHKSSARSTTETLGNTLMSMIAGSKPKSPKASSKKKVKTSSSSTKKKSGSSGSSAKRLDPPKEQKLLEYRPGSKDGKEADDASGIMVVYKPAPDHFLSLVNKGPDSDRGCSVNKVLKRLHRERVAQGVSVNKVLEEKDLFKSLRMKKNDRGEIVLFVL